MEMETEKYFTTEITLHYTNYASAPVEKLKTIHSQLLLVDGLDNRQ